MRVEISALRAFGIFVILKGKRGTCHWEETCNVNRQTYNSMKQILMQVRLFSVTRRCASRVDSDGSGLVGFRSLSFSLFFFLTILTG